MVLFPVFCFIPLWLKCYSCLFFLSFRMTSMLLFFSGFFSIVQYNLIAVSVCLFCCSIWIKWSFQELNTAAHVDYEGPQVNNWLNWCFSTMIINISCSCWPYIKPHTKNKAWFLSLFIIFLYVELDVFLDTGHISEVFVCSSYIIDLRLS